MNKRRIFSVAFIVLILLSVSIDLNAQNRRIGTAAASELLIPVGARDLAMGGSPVASTKGVEAIYWNPAGLSRMGKSAESMFSSMSYIADIGVSYIAVGGTFGSIGTFGVSLKSLNIGDILVTTNDDPDGLGGRIFSPNYLTVGFTYSNALTDAISAGATVKLVSEQIDRVSASSTAFDFGMQYNNLAGISGLAVGVTLKNIGSQMRFDGSGLLRDAVASGGLRPTQKYKSESASFELPSLFEIGLSYNHHISDKLTYSVNSTFTNNNLYRDEYKVGGEVGYKIEEFGVYARAGQSLAPKINDAETDDIFGTTLGFGVTTQTSGIDIIFDYAYRQVQYFNANQVFSVKFGF